MVNAGHFNEIFDLVIKNYHLEDRTDQNFENPFEPDTLSHLLYHKCWVDTVQWHLEDIIRNPEIEPVRALEIKRLIDSSNQHRTDLVEKLDDLFMEEFKNVVIKKNARINTESPAWAIDRLSILALKIYHMEEQVARKEVGKAHHRSTRQKLNTLLVQRQDLTQAISELVGDIRAGKRIMKVYRQLKMYNDPSLNPVLYKGIK